jgi:hypothetical protein
LEPTPIKPLCDKCIGVHRATMLPTTELLGYSPIWGPGQRFMSGWVCADPTCQRIYIPELGYRDPDAGPARSPFRKGCECNNNWHFFFIEENDAGDLRLRCPSCRRTAELPQPVDVSSPVS